MHKVTVHLQGRGVACWAEEHILVGRPPVSVGSFAVVEFSPYLEAPVRLGSDFAVPSKDSRMGLLLVGELSGNFENSLEAVQVAIEQLAKVQGAEHFADTKLSVEVEVIEE